jgi:CheY-like chemotaxis protein
MNPLRTVLVIEDTDISFQGIRQDLEQGGWRVERASDEAMTWRRLEQLRAEGQPVHAVALDLALPPFYLDPMRVGLPLAHKLRERYSTLPIMAYTSLHTARGDNEDFSLILAKLLVLRISLIFPRHFPGGVTFADLLDRVAQGFVILSPEVAGLLPFAVPSQPDPLSAEQWKTLRLLHNETGRDEMGRQLGEITPRGVQARLDKIVYQLQDAGQLEEFEDKHELLKQWYRENYVRYCRESD